MIDCSMRSEESRWPEEESLNDVKSARQQGTEEGGGCGQSEAPLLSIRDCMNKP